jgi:protein-tyrosine phosphatase
MPLRRIPLSVTLNTRDLGGYPTADGKATQFGRIIRSDAPLSLSPADVALLNKMGITAAIDFRADKEIAANPSAFADSPDFHYYHCPFAVGTEGPGQAGGIPALYMRIIIDFPIMSRVMRLIAENRGGVLIHCAAGKDRTGVVSALLLLIAGVDTLDILADYQISYTYRQPFIRKLKEQPGFDDSAERTDIESMDETLRRFYQTYGSIDHYLAQLGIDTDEQKKLTGKLLDEASLVNRD